MAYINWKGSTKIRRATRYNHNSVAASKRVTKRPKKGNNNFNDISIVNHKPLVRNSVLNNENKRMMPFANKRRGR